MIHALDGAVAGHLLRMLHALRLLGASAVVTGITPDVARALVASGVDLGDTVLRATLRDGLHHCMTAPIR